MSWCCSDKTVSGNFELCCRVHWIFSCFFRKSIFGRFSSQLVHLPLLHSGWWSTWCFKRIHDFAFIICRFIRMCISVISYFVHVNVLPVYYVLVIYALNWFKSWVNRHFSSVPLAQYYLYEALLTFSVVTPYLLMIGQSYTEGI